MLYTGIPVEPMSSTTSFPLSPQPLPPEKRELAAATASMSRHWTPASESAARIAERHSSVTDFSGNFPNGCMPTPRTATSLMLRTLRFYGVRLEAAVT
jgi:hypothetical protein